jgi:cyclic pyranopterin phosphate synthase
MKLPEKRKLVDRFGREVTSLRISLTRRCNLNCVYCHKEGDPQDQSQGNANSDELGMKDVVRVTKLGSRLGIRNIKFTGGEPLLRKDLPEIISGISKSYKDISITTNATLLSPELAQKLKKAGLNRINISLDTLDPEKYAEVTGKNLLKKALAGLDAAVSQNFFPIKLNMVVMKGFNESDIWEMLNFSKEKGVILQLIELHTPLENESEEFYQKRYFDLRPIEKDIESRSSRILRKEEQSRCKYWIDGGEVEIVRPMHNTKFCQFCKRLRVTAKGEFKPCLLRRDNHVSFLECLESSKNEDLEQALFKAIDRKEPYWK